MTSGKEKSECAQKKKKGDGQVVVVVLSAL
jgi:hypothetical protein